MSLELGPAPIAIGLTGLAALGWWGFANRHQTPQSRSKIPRPVLRAPTPVARPVAPGELAGVWQFYLDAASSTIRIDFRDDGTFSQAITDNRGNARQYSGGRWTQTGPALVLDGYRSASLDATGSVQWFIGDAPHGLVLFATDAPGVDPRYQATRAAFP